MKSLLSLIALLVCTLSLNAQWQHVLENDGGPMLTSGIARTPDGVMWLGTENGLFTSVNNGTTWTRHLSIPANWKVKVIKNYGSEILVFALQRLDPSHMRAWLNRSFDAGANWETSLIDVPQQANPEIMFTNVFKSDSVLFVQFGDGLFKSGDAGKTWELSLGGSELLQNSSGNDSIIAATYRTNYNGYFSLYISRDKGTSWEKQTLPGQNADHVRGILVHKNTVLAAMSNRKIAVSATYGNSWAGADLTSALASQGSFFDLPSNFRWDEVLNRPVAQFNDQFYSSTNGGFNWTSVTPEPFYSTRSFLPEGNRLSAAGTFGFATRNTAGAQLVASNSGIFASSPTVVKTIGNEIYAAFNTALFRSTDAGANWSKFDIPLLLQPGGKPITDVEKSGDTLFLLTQKGLIVSVDNGVSWPSAYTKIVHGYRLMFGFPGELWVRQDYNNVTVLDRHNPAVKLRYFTCLLSNPSDQAFDYLILPDSNLILALGFSYGKIYASSDSGNTWVVRSNAFNSSYKPWHIGMLGSGRLLAYGPNGKPYYSDDAGLNWNTSSLVPLDISGISQVVETPDGLFATSSLYGLLKSADNGQTWVYPLNNALGANFNQIAYAQEMVGGTPVTRLVVGAVNNGVWRYDPSIPPDFIIDGIASSCSGNTQTYCVPAATSGNTFCTWTAPVKSHINGQGDILLLKGAGSECANVTFGTSTGYVSVTRDAEDYPVARTASKFVGLVNLQPTVLPGVTIAYEDLPFNSPLTGAPVKNYPGLYTFVAGPFTSQSGCDSTVQQSVKVLPPVSGTALGTVYWDYDNNGVFNTGVDELADGVIVQGSSGVFTTTNAFDPYGLAGLQPGDTIRVIPPAPGVNANPAFYIYQAGLWGNHNFRLFAPVPQYDLLVDLTNSVPFRPGFNTNVKISVRNIGLQTAQNVQLKLTLPTFIDYLTASPLPSGSLNDTLIWNVGELAYDSVFQVNAMFYAPSGLSAGMNVIMSAVSLPVSSDGNPASNFYTLKTKTVKSIDPNDKQVDPEYVTPSMLANGQALEYTIRFQNTGNYPAEFVKVIDTLSQSLDPGTFHFISSSHPCTWNLRGHGVVEFFFENIQLSDSVSNEPASHGFVKFSVAPKKNLSLGTFVENFCDIYFDYNDPVRTNTAKTQVVYFVPGEGLAIPNKQLLVRPNPAAFHLFCNWQQPAPADGRIRLFDTTGLPRLEAPLEAGDKHLSIDIQSLPPGLYFVVLEAGDLLLTNKAVIVQPDILGTGF